jgi:serine/threonine-protein kinase
MNHTSKNQGCRVFPGTAIIGKWHRNTYTIISQLGSGATGTVYLARSHDKYVALKISKDSLAITSEVNVLKHFSKVQGKTLGPSLIDVDDWEAGSQTYPFYAMEYLRGETLFTFLQSRKPEWAGILMVQLLADLAQLHQAGWVFGDLKPDNLLVVGSSPRIRWIDVGGTTLIGRSIKEYTEFFDRGYWGMGTRKAEPAYDLFAAAMVMMNFAYPNRFEKNGNGWEQLKMMIETSNTLNKYESVVTKALQGKYSDAGEMRLELVELLNAPSIGTKARKTTNSRYKAKKPDKRKTGMMETTLLFSLLLLIYIFYLFGQT